MTEAKQHLKTILHPYLFILKEGGEIKNNLLDYSLIMLLVNSSETIKSPAKQKKKMGVVFKKEINLRGKPTLLGKRKHKSKDA